MRTSLLLVLCTLLVAASAVAQIPMPVQVIPIAGKTKGGQGTDWVTDLSIANIGTRSGTIGIHYFPANTGNTFNGTFSKTMALAGGRSLYVKDVVASWFPQFGTATSGFLVIADITTPANCQLEDPPQLSLISTSRTYNNADPRKTYGQTVPEALFRLNFTSQPSVIPGVVHQPGTVPGFRSNVGVVNLSTQPISVRVTAFRTDGTNAGSGVKAVEPLTVRQWSLSDFGIQTLAAGRVEFKLESGIVVDPCSQAEEPPACMDRCETGCGDKYGFSRSAAFIAWASKVDNGSGDAEFMLPAIDWFQYNSTCESSGTSPIVKMLQRFGFGPPPSLTIRKVPRRR